MLSVRDHHILNGRTNENEDKDNKTKEAENNDLNKIMKEESKCF